MLEHYTAAEAIKRLDIPRSTFYYLVDLGEIPKVVLPLRKQALYPKEAIEMLVKERGEKAQGYLAKPERLAFVIPTMDDLRQLIEIERTIWGDVGIIDPKDIVARFPYNAECIHVLKDTQLQKVVGSITFSPLVDGVIEKLISFQMDESDIKPADYLPFTTDKPLDCYVVSIVACQDINTTRYAFTLLRETERYIISLAERGVTFRRIYTIATTEDGERLSRKLGFVEMPSGKGPLGDKRKPFVLNLDAKNPTSELVKNYQNTIKNRKRRAKRQQKREAIQPPASPAGTDWIKISDLPYVLALDYEVYGPDASVDIAITRTWWEKNPYACRIMFDARNRREVWGALTVLPMEEEIIFRLLKGELEEHDITANDVLRYEPGNRYVGYVASTIVRPEHRNDFRTLLQGVLDFWCENYGAFQIDKLYAYPFSDEGMSLIKHLFFSPRYDLDKKAYELELNKPSPSRLVRGYQECIKRKSP